MKSKKLIGTFLSLSLFAGVLAGCSSSSNETSSSEGEAGTIKIGANLELSEGQLHLVNLLQKGLN